MGINNKSVDMSFSALIDFFFRKIEFSYLMIDTSSYSDRYDILTYVKSGFKEENILYEFNAKYDTNKKSVVIDDINKKVLFSIDEKPKKGVLVINNIPSSIIFVVKALYRHDPYGSFNLLEPAEFYTYKSMHRISGKTLISLTTV